MSRDPLTKEQMEAMNFEKVWISYGVDENGVEDGEWGVILFGRLYSIDALEGAGMEELLQDLSNGESLSDAEKQHSLYSAWLPGTAWWWGEVVQDLKRLKVETGSLACLGCKRERQCATKGCFIIREALCLLGVSDLDTVTQATDLMGHPRWRRIMNKYFALRLKYLREKHGFSQAELADRIGVSRGSISFYENNSRVPDIDVLGSLCDFFSVSSDYLLGRSDQVFPLQSSDSTLLGVEQNTLSPAMREACAKFQSDLHRLYNTVSKTEFERFFPVVSKCVTDLIIHLSFNTSKGGEGEVNDGQGN